MALFILFFQSQLLYSLNELIILQGFDFIIFLIHIEIIIFKNTRCAYFIYKVRPNNLPNLSPITIEIFLHEWNNFVVPGKFKTFHIIDFQEITMPYLKVLSSKPFISILVHLGENFNDRFP